MLDVTHFASTKSLLVFVLGTRSSYCCDKLLMNLRVVKQSPRHCLPDLDWRLAELQERAQVQLQVLYLFPFCSMLQSGRKNLGTTMADLAETFRVIFLLAALSHDKR